MGTWQSSISRCPRVSHICMSSILRALVMSAPFSGLAVILHGVAVVEGAPLHVLPTQAHRVGSQVQPGRRIRIFTCMPTPRVLRDIYPTCQIDWLSRHFPLHCACTLRMLQETLPRNMPFHWIKLTGDRVVSLRRACTLNCSERQLHISAVY